MLRIVNGTVKTFQATCREKVPDVDVVLARKPRRNKRAHANK